MAEQRHKPEVQRLLRQVRAARHGARRSWTRAARPQARACRVTAPHRRSRVALQATWMQQQAQPCQARSQSRARSLGGSQAPVPKAAEQALARRRDNGCAGAHLAQHAAQRGVSARQPRRRISRHLRARFSAPARRQRERASQLQNAPRDCCRTAQRPRAGLNLEASARRAAVASGFRPPAPACRT